MPITMDHTHVPGRIRRVRSINFPLVMHWGIEGMDRDSNGQPTMWHAQKNDVLRCTSYIEFSAGQPSEIVWTPEAYMQGLQIIRRLQSIEGTKWTLVQANCEQIVRWAVEGRAHSDQLAVGVLAAIAVTAVLVIGSGS